MTHEQAIDGLLANMRGDFIISNKREENGHLFVTLENELGQMEFQVKL